MNRRNFLKFASICSVASAFPLQRVALQEDPPAIPQRRTPPDPSFSYERLKRRAEGLAQQSHVPPRLELPGELSDLSRERYQAIQFKQNETLWRNDTLNFQLKFFHTGFQYRTPVDIDIIENGVATPFDYSPSLFDFNPPLSAPPADSKSGFSGISIESIVHNADELAAFLAFQGATFFRALATNQVFGLSARALSINTAQSRGEEFPFFRKIWIEKPALGERTLTIYALMDGPSVTGAYRFRATPGDTTAIDVETTIFPRVALGHVGIAPISSMYFNGGADVTSAQGYRPNVHSSDGLQIWNAPGEWIWRPITNPDQLQYSVFVDRTPRGFGLLQRKRNFSEFEDLDARFDLQPSLWIEPFGNWNDGAVDLIEVPSRSEIFSNIIVFWRPRYTLEAGGQYTFNYRLHWGEDIPIRSKRAEVAQTLINQGTNSRDREFIIDFVSSHSCLDCNSGVYDAELRVGAGEIRSKKVQPNPATGGVRVSFMFGTDDVRETDLSCQLKENGQVVSETWVYRWTG